MLSSSTGARPNDCGGGTRGGLGVIGGNSDIVSALSSARSSATESTVTSRSDEEEDR